MTLYEKKATLWYSRAEFFLKRKSSTFLPPHTHLALICSQLTGYSQTIFEIISSLLNYSILLIYSKFHNPFWSIMIMTHPDRSWHILIHHNTFWSIMTHPDPSLHILIDHDTSWSIITHHDRSSLIMIEHDSYWSITTPINIYIYPQTNILIYTDNMTAIWSLISTYQFIKVWELKNPEKYTIIWVGSWIIFYWYINRFLFKKFKNNNQRFAISDTKNKVFINFL